MTMARAESQLNANSRCLVLTFMELVQREDQFPVPQGVPVEMVARGPEDLAWD
jgi:hypothetical protein